MGDLSRGTLAGVRVLDLTSSSPGRIQEHCRRLLALGVTAALDHRERTGAGQQVNLSLPGTALSMQAARFIRVDGEPRDASRDMRSGGVTGIHPWAVGHLCISANTAHFWKALCEPHPCSAGIRNKSSKTGFSKAKKRMNGDERKWPEL